MDLRTERRQIGSAGNWRRPALAAVVFLLAGPVAATWADPKVTVIETPNGGIQPQTVVDAKGGLHLIYFKGDPRAGDIYYVRRESSKERFSGPIRVNSQAASAIATGTVRGGQIALGKGGRAHVFWNGSGKGKSAEGMFYARLNDAGTGFEDQRNLMRRSSVPDGGGTLAADSLGNVYVAWHGLKNGGPRGEDKRQVWVARSSDDGKSFSEEQPAWMEPTGACACCSTRAFADSKSSVYMLYRSANDNVNRDMYLLSSSDQGKTFQGSLIHKWKAPG
jgi:hypothetical protein